MSFARLLFQVLPMATGLSCLAASNEVQTAISSFPDISADRFRPDRAVDCANALMKAGKDAACAVLDAAARARDGVATDNRVSEKVCFLCRLCLPLRAPVSYSGPRD